MSEAIAIIGMAGRFPQSPNPEALWKHLAEGRELVTFFSDEEARVAHIPEAVRSLPNYVRARALLDGPEMFDARFFGLSPTEAMLTDPQQRLFLECAYEALEDAGYDPSREKDLIGVYGGADVNSYAVGHLLMWTHDLMSLIGNDKDYLATRVAYKLDLRGPAVTVQTACSTSLVAVHLAARALIDYQCDMALAGGVCVAFPQRAGYLYQEGGILSPDGHCRTFDAKSRGTVGGDGCGIVVLKRLDDALAARDPIRAVILGGAVNNDGAKKMAFTAPSVEGQAEVVALAHAVADVSPDSIDYIEAHGTGTPLGDPIEMAALSEVFRDKTERQGFCAIGSLKSNLGHMSSAAGVGGLIKTILSLQHQQIPPSLFFEKANPQIDFEHSPFFVNTSLRDWPRCDHPRRAGVSSFGVGGTNAHLVLEEAPEIPATVSHRKSHLLLLSARSETALASQKTRLAAHLAEHPDLPLADVSYTLLLGRKRWEQRTFVLAENVAEAQRRLAAPTPSHVVTAAPEVIFLFPGQGSQSPRMAAGLYGSEPLFREAFDRAADAALPHLHADLRTLLFQSEASLDRTSLVQPALLAVEYALASFLLALGARPTLLVGHSVGELTAAVIAEVMSIEDAMQLVVARGRIMDDLPPGAMLAVTLPEAELRGFAGLDVAVQNAPDLTVLSGPPDAISAAEAALKARRVAVSRLTAARAFHSHMMDPAIAPLTALVERIPRKPPAIPILSTVTGRLLTDAEALDAAYWGAHLRKPVRFAAAFAAARVSPKALFVEVGPGRTLLGLARRMGSSEVVATMRAPGDSTHEQEVWLAALGSLVSRGVDLNLARLYENEARGRVPLPTYPFERERYSQTFETASWSAPSPASPSAVLYAPTWQRVHAEAAADPGPWLVLRSADESGSFPAEALHDLPHRVVADLEALAQAALELSPSTIVCDGPFDEVDPRATVLRLLDVVRALPEKPVRLILLSKGGAQVLGDEPLTPASLSAAALGRVVRQELAHVVCTTLDIMGASPRAVVDALRSPNLRAHEALRGSSRFVEKLEPLPASGSDPFQEDEVVVILGGLGHVGLTLARHIAKKPRKGLVLTSRTGLPSPTMWDDWLASHREDDPVSQRIKTLRSIEAGGTKVLAMSSDVCEKDRMLQVFERAKRELGPVTTVLSAVGVAGGEAFRAIQDTRPADVGRLFRAKHDGLLMVLQILPESVRRLVLASSLSVPIGGVGLGAYAAANAYLDASAESLASDRALRVVAIDWDAFRPATGPSDDASLSPDEVGALLDTALSHPSLSRFVVVKGDLAKRLERAAQGARSAATEAAAPREKHPRPDLGIPYTAPETETEKVLAAIWSDVLSVEPVGIHDNFFKLGGDSLLAIQVSAKLRAKLDVEIPVGDLFEEATIHSLSARIDAQRSLAQANADALLEKLAMVEGMSDEEVARMLAELGAQDG